MDQIDSWQVDSRSSTAAVEVLVVDHIVTVTVLQLALIDDRSTFHATSTHQHTTSALSLYHSVRADTVVRTIQQGRRLYKS